MIQVTVKLFATLRQQAGWAEQTVALSPEATVADLLVAVEEDDSELVLVGRPVYVAVNQEYAHGDTALQDGDVVAIFPPVSGGRGAGPGEIKSIAEETESHVQP